MIFRPDTQADAEPCRPSLVVLDFDGTLTDADAHAPVFREASQRALAQRLGWDATTLERAWREAEAALAALPANAAWVVGGEGVCAAVADPYVIANGIVQRVLERHRPDLGAAQVTAGVLEVHRAAYDRVAPPFRAEARDVLEALCASDFVVRVVSNTSTDVIARRLDELSLRGRERIAVRGGAGKFVLCACAPADARFDALPVRADWPEVGRGVHLRRGRYFDALRGLWDETGADAMTTLVVGDVFELDLAMPAALGAHVHLVTRASTVDHERRLALRLARGDAAPSLTAVIERLADGVAR